MNNKNLIREFYLLFHQYNRGHFSFSLPFIALSPNRLVEDDSNIANIIVINTNITKLNKYIFQKDPLIKVSIC